MVLDLSILNDEQLQPVLDTEGAVLVTAGAGSGKTRLLTHRIAHLIINLGVPAYNILAITFTNKAAREMKERMSGMIGEIDGADQLFVSTFHSLCVFILRRYIHKLGYSRSFSIYDEDEKKKVIKAVAAKIDPDSDSLAASIAVASGRIKNAGEQPEWYKSAYHYLPDVDTIVEGVRQYQEEMRRNDALDFDDLLLCALQLLSTDIEARDYCQRRFVYIHVDEFQDTNIIQYKIVKILAGGHGNLFAVGDEDQSIYGWRGANIENIRDFMRDFDCRVYKLEQNYRSSKNILELANNIIKNNSSRIEKKLWTENDDGLRPQLFVAESDSDEADFVMQTVKGLNNNGHEYSSMAVLMRVNALSRSIEQKFMFYGVPYRLYGGFKFYDRKEIKDIMAYLKLICNHRDGEAAARVIAFPKRGIGEASVEKLKNAAREFGVGIFDIIMCAGGFLGKAAGGAGAEVYGSGGGSAGDTAGGSAGLGTSETGKNNGVFDDADAELIRKYLGNALVLKLKPLAAQLAKIEENKELKVSSLIRFLYNLLQIDQVYGSGSEDDDNRILNVKELINSVMQTEERSDLTLDEYVQQVMLLSDLDADEGGDAVNLFTVHSAKGLEFDTVFIIGAEDGLFPLARAMDSAAELEEERRLMYVALTRAKKRLFICHTRRRFMYGRHMGTLPSRFLTESGLVKKREPFAFMRGEGSGERTGGFGGSYGNSGGYSGGYSSGYGSGYTSKNGKNNGESVQKNLAATVTNMPASAVDLSKLHPGVAIRHKRLGKGVVKSVDTAARQAEVEFDTIGVLLLSIDFAPITIL